MRRNNAVGGDSGTSPAGRAERVSCEPIGATALHRAPRISTFLGHSFHPGGQGSGEPNPQVDEIFHSQFIAQMTAIPNRSRCSELEVIPREGGRLVSAQPPP